MRLLSLMQKGKIKVWVLLRRKSSILFIAMENLNLKLSHSKLLGNSAHQQEYETSTFSVHSFICKLSPVSKVSTSLGRWSQPQKPSNIYLLGHDTTPPLLINQFGWPKEE